MQATKDKKSKNVCLCIYMYALINIRIPKLNLLLKIKIT